MTTTPKSQQLHALGQTGRAACGRTVKLAAFVTDRSRVSCAECAAALAADEAVR